MTTEYGSGLSVDDILSEFQAQWVRDSYGAYVPDEPEAEAGEEPGSGPSPAAGYRESDHPMDEDGVRVYRPRSALAAMEEEARQIAADLARQPRETAESDPDGGGDAFFEAVPPEEPEDRGGKGRSGFLKRLGGLARREKKPREKRTSAAEGPYEDSWDGTAEPAPETSREEEPQPEDYAVGDYAPQDYGLEEYAPEEYIPENDALENYASEDYSLEDYAPESGGAAPEAGLDFTDLRAFAGMGLREEPGTGAPAPEPAPAPREEFAFRLEDMDPDYTAPREPAPGDGDLGPAEDSALPGQDESGSPGWEEPEEQPKKRLSLKRSRDKGRKKKQPLNAPPTEEDGEDYAFGFDDTAAGPGEYAPAGDYDAAPEEEEPEEYLGPMNFPSFRDYLVSLVTGFVYRLRGFSPGGGATTATMVDTGEDLGAEVPPAAASKHYGSFVHSLRLRFRISLVLLLIMTYISLGLPVPGMLKSVHVAAGMCLAIQLTIMLLSLDVVTGAVMNITRGRMGADSMAVFSCLLTSVDALCVALDGFGSLHRPLCAVSSLSLVGVLLASLLSARGLRKSLRVPAIAKRCYTVTAESLLKRQERDITLIKTARPASGFVRRSEEAPPDETVFIRLAPLFLAGGLILGVAAAVLGKRTGDILFVLSAVFAPAVPVTALLAFSLPFFVGSMRIFSSGAAIAGWSGLCDIGQSRNLIVTDRDLFPEDSVELESIRIFADEDANKIISYAGTMMVASGASISSCFGKLMEENNCSLCKVENFEFLSGGGMRGVINGETVLCGSSDLMRLMNVRIPFRLVEKTTVLLAVDGILYGIFNMKYTPQPQVRKALVGLMRSNRHPVFAIRDFNITPEMLHQSFDVATDGYDFPPYVERFDLSEAQPTERSKIAAVVCREGLGPLTRMADTGRSMYVTVRINVVLTLAAAVTGMLAVFIRLAAGGGIGVGFLLAYMLLWAVPVALLSLFLRF